MRIRVMILLLGVALIGACGIQPDDRVITYNAGDLPDVLANTTTTTTTTTTLPAPPTSPPVTPVETTPIDTTTTSTPGVELTQSDGFYLISASDELQRVRLNLFEPATIQQLITQLEMPPPEVSSSNLRTSVQRGLIVEVQLDRGTATVDLDPDVLDRISTSRGNQAISQIVLTLTSFVTTDQGGIGMVQFTVDGQVIPVFFPSANGSSDEPAAFDDFAELVIDAPANLDPSSTDETSPTSDPDDTEPDSDSGTDTEPDPASAG